MIYVKTPYSFDKNLGREYNKAFDGLNSDDWVCLIDYDVMFLTPDAIRIMQEYVITYPDTGIFTCFTNRIHPLAVDQLLNREVSENDSIKFHQALAYEQKKYIPKVTEISHEISGFLMLISKKTHDLIKFREDLQYLGVDNHYSWDVLAASKRILRMDGLYVFHSYRLNDIKDKSHLL